MKNKIIASDRGTSAFHKELLEIAEITGEFRSFCEQTLLPQLPGAFSEAKELLRALSEAKQKGGANGTETLTLQVAAFFESINIQLYDPVALDVLNKLTSQYWVGSELKAFEFLVVQVDYPKDYWRNILYIESDFRSSKADGPQKEIEKINGLVADRIAEGLIKFIREDPPRTSPYSIYFWLDRRLCRRPDSEKSDIDDYRCILDRVLQQWTEAQLSRNDENSIYRLWDWLYSRNLNDLIDSEQEKKIQDQLNERPTTLPPYPLSLKDITYFIKALNRRLWDRGDEEPYPPTEEDRRYLHAQLEDLAKLCAEDRLKANLPIRTIRDLISVFDWVPDGRVKQIGDPHQDRLAIKHLALMRGQLQNARTDFDVFDFQITIRILIYSEKEADVLRQLFMTLRKCCGPCCDESTEFRQKVRTYAETDLTTRLDSVQPEYCVSILIDILINRLRSSGRLRQICLDLGEFFLSRLKMKAKRSGKLFSKSTKDFYTDEDCMEPNPCWRRAYVEALGELGYAHNGKVLRSLDFIRKHDPNDGVRACARSTYRVIHRERTKALDDWKGLRAAFWAVRKAQREAIGKSVDEAGSKLLRRQELRGEHQTRSDGIYDSFLKP